MADTIDAPSVPLTKTASIDDLFLAFRACYLGARIEVTDEQGRRFRLQIQGLTYEAGSGRAFIVTGYAQRIDTAHRSVSAALGTKVFKAFISYKGGDRRGFIQVAD